MYQSEKTPVNKNMDNGFALKKRSSKQDREIEESQIKMIREDDLNEKVKLSNI